MFNNISNGDKLQCQRSSDSINTTNTFNSLFANVLGSDNNKQNTSISDNSLIISLIKLCSSLIYTELPRQPCVSIEILNHNILYFLYYYINLNKQELPIPEEEEELSSESQTDETKAEQLNTEGQRTKVPCIADSGKIKI